MEINEKSGCVGRVVITVECIALIMSIFLLGKALAKQFDGGINDKYRTFACHYHRSSKIEYHIYRLFFIVPITPSVILKNEC